MSISSIWCWDSNPQPLEHESSPVTTRPGLPPIHNSLLAHIQLVTRVNSC